MLGGLVPVNDIINNTLSQYDTRNPRGPLNPLHFTSRFSSANSNTPGHNRNQTADIMMNQTSLLHESLTLGPEHHLVTKAMNVRTRMPPNVMRNQKKKVLLADISQPYRKFMHSRNYYRMPGDE